MLLRAILLTLDHSAIPGETIPPVQDNPPNEVITVTGLLYASLFILLLAAFVAMLGKQWLNRYLRNSGGVARRGPAATSPKLTGEEGGRKRHWLGSSVVQGSHRKIGGVIASELRTEGRCCERTANEGRRLAKGEGGLRRTRAVTKREAKQQGGRRRRENLTDGDTAPDSENDKRLVTRHPKTRTTTRTRW
jgi:hypothetical protein